ncbi:MAG: hypothetical protein Q9227_002403 [Pyrenula ochraceoflavens]
MTVKTVPKFTPEVLLSAPRRSAGTPSADGKLVLYTQSVYSFESHSKTSEIRILDISNGTSKVITSDLKAAGPKWLGDGHDILWLKESSENGNTSFIIGNADDTGKTYVAGTVPGSVGNLKIHHLEQGKFAVAVTGKANPDGSLFNPKGATSSHSTGKLYDSLYIRHWDDWVTQQKNAIFTTVLQQSTPKVTDRRGKYSLFGLTNILNNTGLECPFDPPSDGVSQFDISSTGIVFCAKSPHVNPATHTKCETYLVPLKTFLELDVGPPKHLNTPGLHGAVTSPVFSPDGKHVAFLQMPQDGYEADRNIIVLFNDVSRTQEPALFFRNADGSSTWDRSPSSVNWAADGKSLLITAGDKGRECLWQIPLTSSLTASEQQPVQLTSKGAVVDFTPAAADSNKLFVSSTSFIDNSTYSIIDPAKPEDITRVSSLSEDGSVFGLSSDQVDETWWKGAHDHPIHAWVIKPSFFKNGNKYPLCFLVHGGPQSAWMDQWSTRWNACVFAEQGYTVVLPNPTGSTTYGQTFTDAIQCQWGGRTYDDLSLGFTHLSTSLPYCDTTRAVAAGASFGGYMMNWIQGQPLGRKFKALACHDGIFSTVAGGLASEEMYFPVRDMGGRQWEERELWEKWDPSRFTENWATPELVIHNDLDFRLTMAEGLAAFNVLQMKGVESRFLTFPDENHFVLQPENSLVWHHTVLNWLNKYAGLPPLLKSNGEDGLPAVGGWKPPTEEMSRMGL